MNRNYFIRAVIANLLFAFLLLFFASCSNKEEAVVPATDVVQEPYIIDETTGEISLRTDCGGADIHWEYEGADGPDHWADLCDAWDCDGHKQSPVNIIPPPTRQLSRSLKFYWKNTATTIVNNGHTIQYTVDQATLPDNGSYISLNGQKYYLLQFHFHAASEHTVKGKHYPVEIHFVHRNPLTGKLAVVGVFVEEGAENPFFENIADTWPESHDTYTSADTYNPNVLMPEGYNNYLKAHFWWYDGSLTTPPCSEIVNWMVWSTTIEASAEQIEQMEEILHENYRPTLPLGSRLVNAQ